MSKFDINRFVIVLTSTVHINRNKAYLHQTDPTVRINVYLKSVRQWLNKTPFKICLVENSGYAFEELKEELEFFSNRFEIIKFDESNLKEFSNIKNSDSKGESELLAINIARQNSLLFKKSIFMIKITARYYIDGLYQHLVDTKMDEKIAFDFDTHPNYIVALRQNNPTRCEMVGCNLRFFDHIFNMNVSDDYNRKNGHVEDIYRVRMEILNINQVYNCPEFDIEPTSRGGVDQIFYNI